MRLSVYKLPVFGAGFVGAYHSGVVVNGLEWSFDGGDDVRTGVYSCAPEFNSQYTFKQRVIMGTTTKSADEIDSLLHRMMGEWPMAGYNLLERNCTHFSSALSVALVGKPSPPFVNALAARMALAPIKSQCQDAAEVCRDVEACLSCPSLSDAEAADAALVAARDSMQKRLAAARNGFEADKAEAEKAAGGAECFDVHAFSHAWWSAHRDGEAAAAAEAAAAWLALQPGGAEKRDPVAEVKVACNRLRRLVAEAKARVKADADAETKACDAQDV